MNVEQIVRENYFEIAEVASRVGVDFSEAQYLVDGTGGSMLYVAPLDKKDTKRVLMGSSIKGNTLIISFFTYRHGRQSVTWKYTEKNGSAIKLNRLSQRRTQRHRRKQGLTEAEKKSLNEQYIRQYHDCDTWVTNFSYLREKNLAGKVHVKKMSDFRGEFIALPILGPKGDIIGLQRIYDKPDPKTGNRKLLTPGIDKKGAYILVGDGKAEDVAVTEGWADAVTINICTGKSAFCALDSGNLFEVTKMLLKDRSPKNITLAADDDRWKPEHGNAGLRAALELSYYKQIKARRPHFAHIEVPECDKPKDFNDLYRLSGAEEVTRQFKSSDGNNIIRAPRKAFEYNLKLLEYTAVNQRTKQLKKTVSAAIRRNLPLTKIHEIVKDSGISPLEVTKVYRQCIRTVSKKTQALHKILNRDAQKLMLKRETHGGYIIEEGQVEKLMALNGIIVLKAPMGSGKTEKIIKEAISSCPSAAYLAHRVILVEEACRRLRIMSYKGAEEIDVRANRRMGVCVNSLNHPKFDQGAWFEDMDTVFIDEGSKVLDHLCGPTIEDKEGVMETFLTMLEVANRVVICDADASDSLIDLLAKMAPERKIHVFQPEDGAPMDHVSVKMATKPDVAYKAIRDNAILGKKLLISTDSKKEVKKIKHKLEKLGVKTLGIHSEARCDQAVDAWIKNPSKESVKYNAVVYNSCVDSGVSLVTDHFDLTIGLFRGVVTPNTIKQMMGRNRTAREWLLVVDPVFKTRFGNTEQEMHQALLASHCKVKWDTKEQKPIELPNLSAYDQVKIATVRRNILWCQDYILTTQIMLEQDGYQVDRLYTENECQSELEKQMKGIGDEIQCEFVKSIVDTSAPLPCRYRKLKEAYAVTEEEYAQIVRYEIENALCTKNIEPEDVVFWIKGGKRKLYLFEMLKTESSELRRYDLFEADKLNSLTLRRNLLTKGDFVKEFFNFLGIDMATGEGSFNHPMVYRFIDWVYSNKNRLLNWNYHRLGPFLGKNRPVDSVKFAKEVLGNLGLRTERKKKGKKRLSFHLISPDSWDAMSGYLKNRACEEKNVASLPEDTQQLQDKLSENVREFKVEIDDWVAEECSCGNPLPQKYIDWGMDQCESCFARMNGEDEFD